MPRPSTRRQGTRAHILRASSQTVQMERPSSVTAVHQFGALVVLGATIALLVAAAWSWRTGRRTGDRTDHRFAVDRLLLLAEALVAVQLGIGGLVLATGERPSDPLHLLYAVAALVTLPVGWAWGGRPDRSGSASRRRRDGWILIATAVLLGVELRLFATG